MSVGNDIGKHAIISGGIVQNNGTIKQKSFCEVPTYNILYIYYR